MGRRKSRRKPLSRRNPIRPMHRIFNCPFCNHEKTCEVVMKKTEYYAKVFCCICLVSYKTSINHLSEPIDVYNEWIDACEAANL